MAQPLSEPLYFVVLRVGVDAQGRLLSSTITVDQEHLGKPLARSFSPREWSAMIDILSESIDKVQR